MSGVAIMPKDNGMHGTQSTVIFDILLLRNSAHECCVQIYTGYRQTATSISSFELSICDSPLNVQYKPK